MKKYGYWFLLLIVLYAFQTSLLPIIAYNGQLPDLLLLFVVSFSLLEGPKYGTLMALGAGLLKGLASGTFFGVDAFIYVVIALVVGKFNNQVFREARFLPLVTSVGASVAYYVIFVVFLFMLGFRFSIINHVQSVLLPMVIYQFIFSYPIHRLTVKMDTLTRTKWSKNGS
ncbi:MAG: rod shape-determining protein MreD [Selenomonadaceae bacterium]|nr:rod shape-determining protein MreD [Selenomonadaceae bacterium]MBP3722631.1 rod shape-determining protein MreD [Selenomonadaceae bacterium]